ncbi:MAG: tRNA (adenosine(37)-N6)-threonylcarbamoyltransferase complex dimerization subunit type 1 TsaB [Firmicutes bacterium]|nr:tRNA (adenosine(37)-N6)-threonylcarbamoyltransferase complex dimerization subunit type 1 TsaB [Bacillota bacterium]
MKFLCINTAGATVQVVLYNKKNIVKMDGEFKKASAVCLPFIDELLQSANLAVHDLDFIAVSIGPGSFTGIRIGLAAARAFSQFSNVPLVCVTHHEILARQCEAVKNSAENIVTISDAANGLSYVAVFDTDYAEILPPQSIKTEHLSVFLDSMEEPTIICPDFGYEKFLPQNIRTIAPFCSKGAAFTNAALYAYHKRGTMPYEKAVPLYVRQSQAEENCL